MQEAISRFLSSQRRRCSPSTLQQYAWYLNDLLAWLRAAAPAGSTAPTPQGVTAATLDAWLASRQHWAPSTQYLAIVACRMFFRWALGVRECMADDLALPRRTTKPQRALTELRLQQLLASLDTSRPKGIRDLSLITLLVDTGLRAAEVASLRIDHVNVNERTFTVRIKGGTWADGVFGTYTGACLVDWLGIRGDYVRPTVQQVYIGLGGLTPGCGMTVCGLRSMFRELGRKVGFPISTHDFRRTFATLSLKGGAPTRLVQIAGRWKDLAMVERYSQSLTPADFERYSPVNAIMGIRPPVD